MKIPKRIFNFTLHKTNRIAITWWMPGADPFNPKHVYQHSVCSLKNELTRQCSGSLDNESLTQFQSFVANDLLGHRFPREGCLERISRLRSEPAHQGTHTSAIKPISRKEEKETPTTCLFRIEFWLKVEGNAAGENLVCWRRRRKPQCIVFFKILKDTFFALDNDVFRCAIRRKLDMAVTANREVSAGCQREVDAVGFHRSSCMRTGRIHARHHILLLQAWIRVLRRKGGIHIRKTSSSQNVERLLRNTSVRSSETEQIWLDVITSAYDGMMRDALHCSRLCLPAR